MNAALSRRKFILGSATLLGASSLNGVPGTALRWGQSHAQVMRPDHIIRASSNENPYGPSRVALQAINRAMADANKYGGITGDIIQLMAKLEDLPASHVTLGTGSGEILNVGALIASLEPGSIVAPDPTFEALPRYAGRMGTEIIRVPVDGNMQTDLDAMYKAIRSDTKMVYVCNPNNPIPSIIEKNALREFTLEVARDRMVFIDEAYFEFVDDPSYASMIDLIREGHNNIIVARTASKIHGMAALRVGFGYAHPDIITQMNEKKTGSLNIVGQHAAYASYQDSEHADFTRAMNRKALDLVESACDDMGIRYVKSHANFSFIETGMDIDDFSRQMLSAGIQVGRAFPPFRSWARVSMQSPEEMAYFVQVFKGMYG